MIGLDLGGTAIKGLLLDDQGCILARTPDLAAEIKRGPEHVIERLTDAADRLCHRAGITSKQLCGVGIGSPGPLDLTRGVILKSANLPGFDNVPLRERLCGSLRCPVELINDASAAAYGEYWMGAGGRTPHMVVLTLGTGVGGGIIVGGNLLTGHFGNAGELGHMVVYPSGRPCNCGQNGCLEAYAGGSYLAREAEQLARDGQSPPLEEVLNSTGHVHVPDIVRASQARDPAASALWNQACQAVALACINLQHAFNPQLIILGGGMSQAGEALRQPIRQAMADLRWKLFDDRPEILLASTGKDAGAIGAAGWFLHSTNGHA